jgi:four helix bundle protein
MKALCVQDLEVYREAFRLQQQIFMHSKVWPKGETYALIDQIRRASRSIGANLAEAWAKRRYPAHLLSKLTDADGELAETHHWIATAEACGYLTGLERDALIRSGALVGRLLGSMLNRYTDFCRLPPEMESLGPVSPITVH